MNISSLKYPAKSHRKTINLPDDSEKLAEFLGAIIGDGGINNNWQLVITLNSILDKEYGEYLKNLCFELFNINATTFERLNENTLKILWSSTTLVDFLIDKGAVRGNKILQNITIPPWINTKKYKKAFIRGLVDTDGCLYIHKHSIKGKLYKNIGFCFTSYSQPLLNSVDTILKEFKINTHVTNNRKRIYLYSEKDVANYLNIFNSSNPRIYNIYAQWRDVRVV